LFHPWNYLFNFKNPRTNNLLLRGPPVHFPPMRSYYYMDSDSDSDDDDGYCENKSNRTKPTCNKPNHTPSEPDCHKYNHENGDANSRKHDNDNDKANEHTQPVNLLSPAPTAMRNDRDPCAPTSCSPTSHTLYPAPSGTQTHLSTPTLPLSTPAPTSPTRATPLVSYERGHVTVSNHAQHVPTFINDERKPAPTNTTSFSPPFLAIFHNSSPSTAHESYKPSRCTFKPHQLVYNHTKADNEEPPPPDFGGGYEEFGMDTKTLEPWDFDDTPLKPPYYWNERDLIREAREGEPRVVTLLLKKWMIVGSQYSEEVQEMWRQQEEEHQERLCEYEERKREYNECHVTESKRARGLAHADYKARKHACANHDVTKPTHHVDAHTTPYSTSRSHPPPWPIKNSIKNCNKYYYGTNTLSGTTPKRRPPPWPIIPTPAPILLIVNPCPPPWPIIPCHLDQTFCNHRNAKRQVKCRAKAESQLTSNIENVSL
jgi:hypothetical protein